MTILICLPLILVIAGLVARRWFITARQDIRSIESHRSTLGHLEHLAPGEAPAGSPAGSAHVRIVGQAAGAAAPPVRPMVWGRPDGRPPAARPAWHAHRSSGARARYEKARVEAMEQMEERPAIVITDAAVAEAGRLSRVEDRRQQAADGVARAAEAEQAGEPHVVARAAEPGQPPAARAPEADQPTVVIGDLDAAPAVPGPAWPAGPHPSPAAPARRRDRPPTERRRHRVLAAAAGLIVVAGGAAVGVQQLGGPGASSTRVHAAAPVPAGGSGRPTSPSTSRSAPTTTAPPALAATSTTATEAVYTVTAGSVHVSLSASAPCWVELRTGSPSGPVAYEGTLPAGANQTFSAGGGLWMRLGDPAGVQVTINGAVVSLPAAANPYDITVTGA